MNENTDQNIEQQPTTPTPEASGDQGEKLFTQADLDRIIGERLAREKGRREVVVWAFRRNTAALAFYQSHGYRIDKTEDLGEPYMAQGTRLIKTLPEEEGP